MSTVSKAIRVQVTPLQPGAGLQGTPQIFGVPQDAVMLTRAALLERGGLPFRLGEPWACQLGMRYIDSDALLQPMDLTNATELTLRVWHWFSRELISTRVQDTVISGGTDKQLELDADPTTGNLTIRWGEGETVDSGLHRLQLTGKLGGSSQLTELALGLIQIDEGAPTS